MNAVLAGLFALVAAQNSVEWSTYSFYSDIPASYQCILPYLPDADTISIENDPSSFISALTAQEATYIAGLLGLTTGCAFGAVETTSVETTGSSEAATTVSEVPSDGAEDTSVASANGAKIATIGMGAGALFAGALALL